MKPCVARPLHWSNHSSTLKMHCRKVLVILLYHSCTLQNTYLCLFRAVCLYTVSAVVPWRRSMTNLWTVLFCTQSASTLLSSIALSRATGPQICLLWSWTVFMHFFIRNSTLLAVFVHWWPQHWIHDVAVICCVLTECCNHSCHEGFAQSSTVLASPGLWN